MCMTSMQLKCIFNRCSETPKLWLWPQKPMCRSSSFLLHLQLSLGLLLPQITAPSPSLLLVPRIHTCRSVCLSFLKTILKIHLFYEAIDTTTNLMQLTTQCNPSPLLIGASMPKMVHCLQHSTFWEHTGLSYALSFIHFCLSSLFLMRQKVQGILASSCHNPGFL